MTHKNKVPRRLETFIVEILISYFFSGAAGAGVAGAAGVAPELAAGLWQALAVEKDLVKGRELWKDLWAISSFLESVNYVAGIKTGLEMLGHPVGPARLPILPLGDAEKNEFRGILTRAGLLAS